eukprot:4855829-Karenia_brevis.AAC.1
MASASCSNNLFHKCLPGKHALKRGTEKKRRLICEVQQLLAKFVQNLRSQASPSVVSITKSRTTEL